MPLVGVGREGSGGGGECFARAGKGGADLLTVGVVASVLLSASKGDRTAAVPVAEASF